MSSWQDYQKNRKIKILVEDVSDSMRPVLYSWLYEVAENRLNDPYKVAADIKNIFRLDETIPRTRPNNYLDAEPQYRFAKFLMNIAYTDSNLFFMVLDYLVQTYLSRDSYPEKLEVILDAAGHKFSVQELNGKKMIVERLSDEQNGLMQHLLNDDDTYASEFLDAFVELYGTNPNYTQSAGESFQALESALKFFLGEDKGKNLGGLLNWLRNNTDKWHYTVASQDQDDAEEQFLSVISFVNKSYRKTKHGQANEKLRIDEAHAEVILRSVALLIFQLENTIKVDNAQK